MTEKILDRSTETSRDTLSSAFATILIDEYIKDKGKLAADLTRDFAKIDKNNNGALSKDELNQAYADKNLSPQIRAESKVLLDNFDSATSLAGNKKTLGTAAGYAGAAAMAAGILPIGIAGASIIVGGLNDLQRSVTRPINSVIDKELAARRRMLESWL